MKRKIEDLDDPLDTAPQRPVKRLSMFDNTPKQWKEQRRRILKMSKQKLKAINDVDCNLRKSVLINNTYRKMKRELRENSPTSSWQYTPKPLFPNRPSSVLMCHSELEWESERHTVAMQFDDINSKELTPPAADLSVVLSDILGVEEKEEIDRAISYELSQSQSAAAAAAENPPTVDAINETVKNCDIVDSTSLICDSDDSVVKSDGAKDTENDVVVLSDMTNNQDIGNLATTGSIIEPMDLSNQSGSVNSNPDNNHSDCDLLNNNNTDMDHSIISDENDNDENEKLIDTEEQECPINYSLNKRSGIDDSKSALTSSIESNGQQGHVVTTSNNNEGQSMVSANDLTTTGSKTYTNNTTTTTQQSASTIEDFIIGGQMDWSQTCDKLNLVYSSTIAGSMLPIIDLKNFSTSTSTNSPFTDITSTYNNNSSSNSSAVKSNEMQQQSAISSSAGHNDDHDSSINNDENNSAILLSTTATSSAVNSKLGFNNLLSENICNANSNSSVVGSCSSSSNSSIACGDIIQGGIDLQGSSSLKDSSNVIINSTTANNNNNSSPATTTTRDILCSENNTSSSDTAVVGLSNCDVDINQHIWACFQQFNMAIACS